MMNPLARSPRRGPIGHAEHSALSQKIHCYSNKSTRTHDLMMYRSTPPLYNGLKQLLKESDIFLSVIKKRLGPSSGTYPGYTPPLLYGKTEKRCLWPSSRIHSQAAVKGLDIQIIQIMF